MGGRLLKALTQRAQALDADVLTLTTEVVYGAWRLYSRQGYRILETYRPIVRPLFPGLPGTLGDTSNIPVEAVNAAAFAKHFRPSAGRPGAVVETWTGEPVVPPVLRPNLLVADTGAISTMRWPVLTRTPEGRSQVWATQILRIQGTQASKTAVLAEADRLAHLDGSVCLYALPATATELPGFSSRGAPLVHRMVRPITPFGHAVVESARAWDEVCPAP
jgi:hypothetical protein